MQPRVNLQRIALALYVTEKSQCRDWWAGTL